MDKESWHRARIFVDLTSRGHFQMLTAHFGNLKSSSRSVFNLPWLLTLVVCLLLRALALSNDATDLDRRQARPGAHAIARSANQNCVRAESLRFPRHDVIVRSRTWNGSGDRECRPRIDSLCSACGVKVFAACDCTPCHGADKTDDYRVGHGPTGRRFCGTWTRRNSTPKTTQGSGRRLLASTSYPDQSGRHEV